MNDTNLQHAFNLVRREEFLPEGVKYFAQSNMPLPIGHGQTNSQPETVYSMLSWLNVKLGDKILDVGSGSGWTTALLAYLAGPTGHVDAVEIVPELVVFGEDNCQKFGFKTTAFHHTEDALGWPVNAPYDRILVSAAAEKVPEELLEQLKVGGIMVIPVKNDIVVITKTGRHSYTEKYHYGYIFVPLRHTAKKNSLAF